MIRKYAATGIVCLLIFCSAARSGAQAVLPVITASADSGVVVVAWNSQYAGLKSISVLRCSDSTNYLPIARIKNPAKGAGTFTDAKPNPGRNFYKLSVNFSSGLNWKTNSCSVYVNKPGAKVVAVKAGNDTAANVNPVEKKGSGPAVATNARAVNRDTGAAVTASLRHYNVADTSGRPVQKPATVRNDTLPSPNKVMMEDPAALPRKKIVLSARREDIAPPTDIKSQFVFIDQNTGHIDLNMPDDVARRHYALKFYDDKDQLVTEIPKVNAAHIIIDKRNFQRKGVYRFVLRKDKLEIEDGYLIIDPASKQ